MFNFCSLRLTPELLHVSSYSSCASGEIEKEVAEFTSRGHYAVNACYR